MERIFSDSKNDLGISEEAFHFMAGVMEHANEMCLITNPLVNSYKRIVPGYEAPVDVHGHHRTEVHLSEYQQPVEVEQGLNLEA